MVFPLFNLQEFYIHFYAYLTGSIVLITGYWDIALISIVLFTAFLIPLSYRKKANWGERGLVTAFFVSLFIEMYGIPLTILFASEYFLNSSALMPKDFVVLTFFGMSYRMDLAMSYGAIMIILGALLILVGWITLYINNKKNKIATSGIYKYSRHPQYLGFILIILGWFIGWPTILTLIFSPILIIKYIQNCRKEEEEMSNANKEYKKYLEKTPFLI
ncbi:MAG: isoprenylcysteine carboxylmethyltransferase family protein [Candidatus Diapherotrites archaeon]